MKKFMQKDLSKAPNFVNRAILRTARVLSQKSQKNCSSPHRHAGKARQKVGAGLKPALTIQF